jgi:hypothetical protein
VVTVQIKQAPSGPVEVGTALQLLAEARNASGGVVGGQLFTWQSSHPAIATVSGLGRVTAVAAGTTTITLQSGAVGASVVIAVVAPAVLRVAMFPTTLAMAPGGSGQFSAAALGSNGTIAGATIHWSTDNPDIATVDASGRVSGLRAGTALIRARSGQVIQTRGVTVSTETTNLRIHRVDFIQVAQNALGDVALVRGKPTAIRLFPEASAPGYVNVPIAVTLRRAGATLFTTTVTSGVMPTSADITSAVQGVLVPLPAALDLDGATLEVEIDPDGAYPERDEWDNTSPVHGDDASAIVTIAVPPLRIRLVPMAPAGAVPPAINTAAVDALTALMRLIYPAAAIDVSVRSASIVTGHAWPDRAGLSDALAVLEIERLADGFDGHYYGVHNQGPIAGIAGLGYLTARSSLGIAHGEVFAHEVGHNMGLSHPPGCGADLVNTGYPYPNGQIGIPGWDPRTPNQFVPATSIDMMGYCGGFRWISGGHYSGILSVLRNRPPATLRAAPADVVPIAVSGRVTAAGPTGFTARRLRQASALSEGGAVAVAAVDAGGGVLARGTLPLLEVADLDPGAAQVAGILAVPRADASRVTALWITVRGATATVPLAD